VTRSVCTVEGCGRSAHARGLCVRDYMRWLRTRRWPQCSLPGCRHGVNARGRCNRHYVQWWRAQKKARTGDDNRSGRSLDDGKEARRA
jgi:hypothetical protein